MKAGPKRVDPRGGIRRRLKNKITETVEALPAVESVPQTELHNTCPKCGGIAKPTDVFCRKDGARLSMGHQCTQCGSPQEPDDTYCWCCGLKVGEQPPAPPPEPAATEDPLVRVARMAKERGSQNPLIDKILETVVT